MKPAGNHEVQHEPQITFEAEADAFTQPAQLHNPFAFDTREWWFRSTQQEKRRNVGALEPSILNSLLERLDVGDDVRQFRHRFLTTLESLTIANHDGGMLVEAMARSAR